MADNRKYYYMRLKEGFFDEDAIKIIESMPDGYLYSNILLKLYLKSLKFDGRLMFNERIPYNPSILATITRHQVGTVEKALEIFEQLDLIEVLDNGAIYMLDIQNLIGKSSTEADRKKEYRARINSEKAKLLTDGGQETGQMSGQTHPEIEIDIEIEKELDIETEKEDVSDKNVGNTPAPKPQKQKAVKHKHGEYKHVLLTDEEYEKLGRDYGSVLASKAIIYLDECIEMKGYKYKSHYLAIRKWVIDAVKEKEAKERQSTQGGRLDWIDAI